MTTEKKQNPRRIIRWDRVKGPKAVTSLVVSTALGAGLSPVAPGTMGSIVALPLAWWSNSWDWPCRVALWAALTAIGTWAATAFDRTMGTSDNQNIVIDEVIGLGITAWTAGRDPKLLAASLVLFRFFDIVKPPPVRQIDLWSKKKSKAPNGSPYWGGFGVIADDIAAGFQGLIVMLILQALHVFG
jgi:phosphatidylglycerophosphatase A